MSLFIEKTSKFLTDVYNSSKLDSNAISVIPSILFLSIAFVALYSQIHDYQSYLGWKGIICKELVFHWAFFYISRLWFVFVKFAKYVLMAIDGYILIVSPKDEVYLNMTIIHVFIFSVVLVVSILPLLMMGVQQLYSPSFQNLIVWVEEDPWLRSEIGVSGHYLQRPAEVIRNPKQKKPSYRSKRSTSADNDLVPNRLQVFRSCKSMIALKVKSGSHLYE